MKVGVIGTGEREKTIAKKLQESPLVTEEVVCIPVAPNHELLALAQQHKFDFTVVGPEEPLCTGVGIVNLFLEHSMPIFGPTYLAAQLEGSKIFAKTRCVQFDIPTADFDFAGNYSVAERIIKDRGFRVVKADGVCGGKGAHVTGSEEEALEVAHGMLVGKMYGKAGNCILLEELMSGPEASLQALCDGKHSEAFPLARDYKRRYDGNKGPNTGGMGAFAPLPEVSAEESLKLKEQFVDKMLRGMSMEGKTYLHEKVQHPCVGIPYKGALFAGIMFTKQGPKLVEYNARFGDPEAEVTLPLVKGDLLPYLLACSTFGRLSELSPLTFVEGAAVCVMLVSPGYPAVGHREGCEKSVGPTVTLAREDVYKKIAARRSNNEYRTDIAAGY